MTTPEIPWEGDYPSVSYQHPSGDLEVRVTPTCVLLLPAFHVDYDGDGHFDYSEPEICIFDPEQAESLCALIRSASELHQEFKRRKEAGE